MALINTGVRALANRLPKVITPKQHAIIDYATAGAFFLGATLFWRSHRKAALGSLACGLAETTTAMLTDYPGGLWPVMDFATHGKVDAGIATTLELLPTLLSIAGESEAWFFRAQGMSVAIVTGMTDFGQGEDAESTLGAGRRIA